MPDRPNILFILTDQQYGGALGCIEGDHLQTPAMDSLAANGVRFDRAYCTYPLCNPSRASLFTGMMPHQVGINDNDEPLEDSFITLGLGHALSNGGYDCVYGGKWHVPEMSMKDGHGFRSICPFNDWELADRCIEYIQDRAGDPDELRKKPFFMVASYDDPHNICEWARQTPLPWGPIEEVPTDHCPNLPPNFEIPAYEPEAVTAERIPRPRSIFRGGKLTEDDWRQYRHVYYRLTERVDSHIGRILQALRDAGLEEETLIIFSSDHGDGLAAHRWNQKSVLYEESVRVPMIMSWKGQIDPRIDDEHLVSNGLDIYLTLCDYAGVDRPEHLMGLSLRSLAERGEDPQWRDHVAVETYFGPNIGGLGTSGRMIRTDRYKYAAYSWGQNREQLFDLREDPGEMVNLAVEARFRPELERHRQLLADWIRQTDDRHEVHYAHPDKLPLVPGQEYQ